MSGAEKAPIDTKASGAVAQAGRDDYRWMESNFGDLYDEFRGSADTLKNRDQSEFRRRLAEHETTLAANESGSAAATQRAMSRAGLRAPSGDVATEMVREKAFSDAATTGGMLNAARRGFRDYSIARSGIGAKVGATIKGMGMSNMRTAAEMESSRNAQNAQNVKGGVAGGLTGALSGGLAGAEFGPEGAIIGGLAGAYQGYN